jgi:hypothetical protein
MLCCRLLETYPIEKINNEAVGTKLPFCLPAVHWFVIMFFYIAQSKPSKQPVNKTGFAFIVKPLF